MSDLRPLSSSISALTAQTFARKFVALGRILNQWNDIVGPELASKCQPVKINYRKPKNKGDKPQATLDIAASSADATFLHYQKGLILAKINQLFGDDWISGIRFVHVAVNAPDVTVNKAISAPNKEEITRVSEILGDVDDLELRNRLEKLGQSVLRKLRSDKTTENTKF
ncbi:MAG: DciA family protein [Pseudobdellovibrionaceae bacterium]